MNNSDYIFKFLYNKGIDTCFMVTGGGSMFLNEALRKNKNIKKVFCHNEQSCAMAADAYFRIKKKPAIVQVTTGPGSINALNGIYGAYVDSIAMIVICGQVKSSDMTQKNKSISKLRQFGDQEAKIITMSKSITKKNYTLGSTSNLIIDLNDAYETTISGRPGPVLIEVPLDIQSKKFTNYNKKLKIKKNFLKLSKIDQSIIFLKKKIYSSKRPIIIVGNGVKFSSSEKLLFSILNKIKIPALTVWNSHDIIKNDNNFYAGRPGMDGERAGNFNLQNCDLLIILGARMHIRQVGFNKKSFARSAYKIMIDIDKQEMKKTNLNINYKINAEVNFFLKRFISKIKKYKVPKQHLSFLKWCKENVIRHSVVQKKHYKYYKNSINPYAFINELFKDLGPNSTIITGDGTAAVVTFKVAKLKAKQMLFTNKGCASMGYDLPAVIGSYFALNRKKLKYDDLICITGDGSIMMNLQELQTIKNYNIPVKIFVLNNDGYHSIRQTQKNYFNGKEIGCGPKSGISFPSFKKIAKAFDFKYVQIKNVKEIKKISDSLKVKKPLICEVKVNKNQFFEPRLVSFKDKSGKIISPPLEEMEPKLSEEVFNQSMIIDRWKF